MFAIAHALDGVSWAEAARLAGLDRQTLRDAVVRYSPELNPVERIWLYLRERFLSHQLLNDCDAVIQAGGDAWNALTATPEPPTLPHQLRVALVCQCLSSAV